MPSSGNAAARRCRWTGGLVRIAWLAIAAMLLGPLAPRLAQARSESEAADAELFDAAEPPGMGQLAPATAQRKRRQLAGLARVRARPPADHRSARPPRMRIESRRRVGVPRRVAPNDDDPDEAQD